MFVGTKKNFKLNDEDIKREKRIINKLNLKNFHLKYHLKKCVP